ncbi:MAG TPA: hypothetical protein PKD55_03845 [Bellilinea sp.]|nr:hypothetical protein [Bellilinea sp.]
MDLDQLKKHLDWLDEERRKDKLLIATLQDRIADLEETVPPVDQRITQVEGDIARVGMSLSRFEQIESTIAQLRVELSRQIQDIEKAKNEKERENDKVRLADLESLNRQIGEVRRGQDAIPDIKKTLGLRLDGENRLGTLIEEVAAKLNAARRSDEEYKRQLKLLEDGQRQDTKHITDLQGEISSIRKRLEEQKAKIEIFTDSIRKQEQRITELLAGESERRQGQLAFMEKQNMVLIEKDRVWREWQSRFEQVENQSLNLDSQLQSLDSLHRSVKQSQGAFDEINARFERRINELTEVQRLVEERFRQEWAAFKADDQKRWTNLTLVTEERQRELGKQYSRSDEKLAHLEEQSQDLQDTMQQYLEETQKRLNALLSMTREWTESLEQSNPKNR